MTYPVAANQRWSPDFTMDALANGGKFRTANLKDDCTRECPAIDVALPLPGSRVLEMLERVARARGCPDVITADNGPELRGPAFDGRAHDPGAPLYFIDPGKRQMLEAVDWMPVGIKLTIHIITYRNLNM